MTIFWVVVYLVIVALLGYLGYRHTHGTSDYLLAGRNIHPFVMALSYGATFISTSAIVGFGGAAGIFGMGILWLTFLNIFMGIFIAFIFFGKKTREIGFKMNSHTFPELIGNRFSSVFLQKFMGIVIFLFMPLYAGVVLIGAAKYIEQQFGIDYSTALFFFSFIIAVYVIMGGLKGVMYTDAFQGSIMFVGMVILVGYTYYILGGFTEAHKALTAMPTPPPLAAKGHQGWTSMPSFNSGFWWVMVSTIIMGVGIGVLAQPQLVVRFMTVRSNRELNRAVAIGGIFILMMTGVAFVTGSLSNVYFSKNVDNLDFCATSGAVKEVHANLPELKVTPKNLALLQKKFPQAKVGDKITKAQGIPCEETKKGTIAVAAAGGEVDNIIPVYIKNAMPHWFGILFMLTLLAAAMSTLSSQFHTMGTAIARDFFEQFGNKEESKNQTVFISKLGIGVTIIISVALAYILPIVMVKGEAIIARGTAIFFGLCAGAFLPAYIAALYWKKATRAGVVSSVLLGFFSAAFWITFVHTAESSVLGIANALFGKDTLISGTWSSVDPMFISLPVSAIVLVLVSMFTRNDNQEEIDRLFPK